MYQRKDRILSGCHEGVLDLFKLLESSDSREVESVKNVIHENLSTAKDSRLLNCIVEYYMALHSERSLDILVRVKDPHDKHLFDKINELMKSENTCYQSLQLLCNLVYKQPSWIYKIAQHRLMNSLFNLLKNDVNAPNLISALLIIVCLLPMIPSQFGPFLPDTFNVFSRLIAWSAKKPSAISETYVLHLQVIVYSLFNRLYGMFPCNFLAYLRSYYGARDYSEENFTIFTRFIKPMLERVRLHPLLVTASKETELSVSRWRNMEYHDVLTDCASISLDAVEGTLEGLRGVHENQDPSSKRHANLCAQNSLQYASLSSQSSITSVEQGSVVNEALSSHRDSLWSPSYSCPASQLVSSPACPLINKTNPEAKIQGSQISQESMPLDLAVEAKPEDLKDGEKHSLRQQLTKTSSRDSKSDYKLSIEESDKTTSISTPEDFSKSMEKRFSDASASELLDSSFEKCILQAVEAKEDIDKEVSELTSSENKSDGVGPVEERDNTPFCSTTQNLTDEPQNFIACADSTVRILSKNQDDDVDEMYTSMQEAEEDMPPYVPPPFSRYRYVSHCGPPPVIPSEYIKKPKVVRSISCPAKFCSTSQSSSVPDADNVSESVPNTDIVATCSNNIITAASAFVIANNRILTCSKITYEHLLPMAMEPLPNINQPNNSSLESNYNSYNTLFTSLSPPEMLDNYIQLGSETYMTQISTIPMTSTKSTDWTHFGGKPPPDEVDILRKQILLLHNQLLFERHRKDVHSERIRRILGRAKKTKMFDEMLLALKDQVTVHQQRSETLYHDNCIINKILENMQLEKERIETELNNLVLKVKLENNQLQFANKKLQSLLVSQKEENDQIIADSKLYQQKIVDLEAELELCKQEIQCYHKIKKDSAFLSKQLFLLQEINNMYKKKIESMKVPANVDVGVDLLSEAAFIEINDLKSKLESTCFQLDAAKSKIVELEQLLANMKAKQKEHYQTIENIKSFHKDEMKVCKEHLADLKKTAIMKDSCILELHKVKEGLMEKLNTLEKKSSGASTSTKESCDNSTLNAQQESTSVGICKQSTIYDNKYSQS